MNETKAVCEETESQGMYLKTIYLLIKTRGVATCKRIADELNFAKSSVSRAVNNLRQDGYIKETGTNYIVLTDKGYEIAKRLTEKYEFFHDRLVAHGVSSDRAYETACRMEHIIPDDVYETLKAFTAANGG